MPLNWFKNLRRVRGPVKPEVVPDVPSILISDDLEIAQFTVQASDGRQWPVHVSVEALASSAEKRVGSCEEAKALVLARIHELERAALRAWARGSIADDVVVIKPCDMKLPAA